MLTSKQRAQLRSLSNDLDSIFQIGKGGISDEMLHQISNALEARELIKISVLENCEFSAKEASKIVAEATGSDAVSVVGRRFVLYRESKKNKRIIT
ncbi:MAG: ribosome assembly RNA-binding protein YhbY [Clostridiales bacterium]|nr:ribosome assembly RNA-binding protein YhbY [Clostridiales bacterium]